ncbi:type 2 isopentenyl-diphosphate Delta-isomerase [Alphaproteobacteria bacterium]|nr:type 2 isopentenyl-diphosphate Delta-isomerase [Alphaproteobacteria bacterium]
MDKPSKKDLNSANRKDVHIDLAKSDISRSSLSHPLDSVTLPYNSLPEINLDEVDTSCRFFDHTLSFPFMITGMTGGTERGDKLNLAFAEIANQCRVALGIGSQRSSLAHGRSQKQLRRLAPSIPIIGNIGGVQLAQENGLDLAKAAIDDLEANAIAIHLNPLQEIIQPEGDRDWRGVLLAIEKAVKTLPCPVLVKEVGAGISLPVAHKLSEVGVTHIDVACTAGTSWAKIEAARLVPSQLSFYKPFLEWGYSVTEIVPEMRKSLEHLTIIGSGGLRDGVDLAKLLWLGCDIGGGAAILLNALESDSLDIQQNSLQEKLETIQQQLSIALFLIGAKRPVCRDDFYEKNC